jgi:formate hydrogenlyase subunit 4
VVRMSLDFAIYAVINTLLVVAAAPFFVSLVKKVKAWTQGRQGPSVFQTYANLAKLLKKEVIYSPNSSRIMRVAPYVNIVSVLVASLFVPLVFVPEPLGGIGNIILFLYLLALARFFMALAGLDAGSSFGGMGSSREMSISAVIEPTTIIVFAALAFVFKTLNIFSMFTITAASATPVTPTLIIREELGE